LRDIINKLDKDLYDLMSWYAEINFEFAKEYLIAEDYMWEKYLKGL